MFSGASAFNQPIGDWNVSAVIRMDGMFQDASAFNQPIGQWDLASIESLHDRLQTLPTVVAIPVGGPQITRPVAIVRRLGVRPIVAARRHPGSLAIPCSVPPCAWHTLPHTPASVPSVWPYT